MTLVQRSFKRDCQPYSRSSSSKCAATRTTLRHRCCLYARPTLFQQCRSTKMSLPS